MFASMRKITGWFIGLLTMVLNLFATEGHAQSENWDTYLGNYDGKPGSVMVDLNRIRFAPDDRLPFLIITGPQAQNTTKNGIPNHQEMLDMEQVLDITTNFITGVTAKVLVGTFTYNNSRVNYYYVKDTVGIRNAINRMYKRNFKDYTYVLNMKHDPLWRTYLKFLYPTEETQDWMDNNKVITRLLASGDSLKTPHVLNFAACFKTDTAASAFRSFIESNGYTFQKIHTLKNKDYPVCTTFSRMGMVVSDSIAIYTTSIKKEVLQHHGVFTGWDAIKK